MKQKLTKLSKVEKALIYLASMLEDVNHDQYNIRREVEKILEIESVPNPKLK